jgi:DNA-binding protein H-NS
MKDLSTYSIAQLRKLDAQVADELKKRHYLAISQAREQILHIARAAGISDKALRAIRPPKR